MNFSDILSIKSDNFSAEAMEQLVNDIGNVRTHLNNTELQLYEANEKISELIESVMYFFCLVWLNITDFSVT